MYADKPDPKIIFVDGDNLVQQRRVNRERVVERLSTIKERTGRIVLVFDGRKGEVASVSGTHPEVVVTAGGDEQTGDGRMIADDYIIEQLAAIDKGIKVEVITADTLLRKQAQQLRAKTINPIKWWHRQLPRLQGLKADYTNPETGRPWGQRR